MDQLPDNMPSKLFVYVFGVHYIEFQGGTKMQTGQILLQDLSVCWLAKLIILNLECGWHTFNVHLNVAKCLWAITGVQLIVQ